MAGLQQRVQHVVVLMLENRSFDHLCGYRQGVNGLVGGHFTNLENPSKPASADNPEIAAAPGAPWSCEGSGPSHSFAASNEQLTASKQGPSKGTPVKNNGYVMSYKNSLFANHVTRPTAQQLALPMQCFTPEQLPSFNALADQFVLCDNWFSEVPGPTEPNRLYTHSATSAGLVWNPWSKVELDVPTIYNRLADAGASFACYWSDDNDLVLYKQLDAFTSSFKDFDESFAADVANGRLPEYTFIDPRFGPTKTGQQVTSQHAPYDVRPGDHLIADVYEALRANPEIWQSCLLVVTYDEHGGFFDHVVPPAKGVPNPDGIDAPRKDDPSWQDLPFSFDRLGLRVPTLLVSPWLAKGKVCSDQLQHTSILASLKELYSLSDYLTKRDASAAHFLNLFQELDQPRTDTPAKLPRAPLGTTAQDPTSPAHPSNRALDDYQTNMVQRALSYPSLGEPEPSDRHMPETAGEASRLTQSRTKAYLAYKKRRHQTRVGRFEVYRDGKARYRWRLLAGNGELVAVSDQSFAGRSSAVRAVDRVKALAGQAGIS